MSEKRQYNVWLTPEARNALEELFKSMGFVGQRGTALSRGLEEFGSRIVTYAFAETKAALEIAAACAAGEDWDELINAIEPSWKGEKLAPLHPGEILLNDFLEPMNVKQDELARSIGVPVEHINEIVAGQRNVTAEIAAKLASYCYTSESFWIGLQNDYESDIRVEAKKQFREWERELPGSGFIKCWACGDHRPDNGESCTACKADAVPF